LGFFEHLAGNAELFLTDDVSASVVNAAAGGFFVLLPDCFEWLVLFGELTVVWQGTSVNCL